MLCNALYYCHPQHKFVTVASLFIFSPACHSSCESCWGPSVSQCTSCLDGFLLHHGQCMEACGEGLYSQDNTCHSKRSISDYRGHLKKHTVFSYCQSDFFWLLISLLLDCHPSCRSCVGPLASDCLRCLKPEEALLPQSIHVQHGICTAGCPAHNYLDYTLTCRGESTSVCLCCSC